MGLLGSSLQHSAGQNGTGRSLGTAANSSGVVAKVWDYGEWAGGINPEDVTGKKWAPLSLKVMKISLNHAWSSLMQPRFYMPEPTQLNSI